MGDDTNAVEKAKTTVRPVQICLAVNKLVSPTIKTHMPMSEGDLAYLYTEKEREADIIIFTGFSCLASKKYYKRKVYLFVESPGCKEITLKPPNFTEVKLRDVIGAIKLLILEVHDKIVKLCAKIKVAVPMLAGVETVVGAPVPVVAVPEVPEPEVVKASVEPPVEVVVAPKVVETSASPPPRTRLSILVVDGDRENRASVERQLHQFNLTVAASYDEVGRIFAEGTKFDVVVTSLTLPAAAVAAGGAFDDSVPVAYGQLVAIQAIGHGVNVVVVDADPSQCIDSLSLMILSQFPGRRIAVGKDTKIVFTKTDGVRHWGQILGQAMAIK